MRRGCKLWYVSNHLLQQSYDIHVYLHISIFIYIYIIFKYIHIYIIHLLQVKITETSERGALLGAKHVHQMNELELRPFSKNEKTIEHLTLS